MARLTGSKRRANQSKIREARNSGTKTKRVKKDGKVYTVTSTDGGKTWTNPQLYSGGVIRKPDTKSTTTTKSKSKITRAGGQKSNEEIFGKKKIDALKIKHSEWKKARKEGTMDEWNKKYKKKKSKFSSSWD